MVDAPTSQTKTPEPASSSRKEDMDDTSEEDDGMAFDEAEFPDLAETFEKEKARLESSKIDLSSKYLRPDTPLRQLTRLAGITVHDLKVDNEFAEPETLPLAAVPTTETSGVDQGQEFSWQLTAVRRQSPESVLTPKTEEPEDIIMSDGPTIPKEITDDREDSLDMSSLPFLAKGPPTPLSDKDQDHFARNQDHVEMVREELGRRFLSAKADEERLEKDFVAMYRLWKREFLRMYRAEEAEELERQKSAEPLPPVATTEPIATPLPTPSIEGGRRAHKFSSEYDIQLAMQESMREAEELRQRQEREAAEAKSGMEKEAELPDLLTAEEASKRRFIDTNQLRQPGQGTTAFDLEPPEDTFTPEEHKLLVQAYQGNPKKWGKLAESLPNRTYKECITHYYATKWAREYKAKDGRKKATKSRIGVRKGPARLKSSNFLADLGRRPDTEEDDATLATPSAVSTDRSRPRRAAAPIFGDNNSELEATPVPTPGRMRGVTARENNGEGTAEKPRRTRAAKEKVPRGRGKNQPLAAAPFPSGVSPQKVDKERKEKFSTLKTEESLLTARQLAEEHAFAAMQQPPRPTEQQTGYFDAISTVAAPAAVSERPRAYSNQSRAGPSSYWSVTETTDFRRYLAHFGTDFNAIASAMGGSKTVQMVSPVVNMPAYFKWKKLTT
ncbi:hypothetical protein W97_05776 [Coniosporium apollinis CBS 100218]|uniref:SANT domain-containing protein n=1 Tax=Coniosporium apollinis (strain CBS 100218) TaxID=1168221 RepID=R7YXZ7_CONA1|nr:uncharacterized protein W97_05776 [Coniosporium apollinis CBS 100218]EON66531.1 hypothetical protein W97_05776 [Coniosporium apollinis CBS 100218]